MQWLVGLNAVRLYAIILIVIYHLFRQFLPGGFIAVEIFFTISGFLIFSKLIREHVKKGKVRYLKFIGERLSRLFPALLIAVVFALVMALFVNPDILANLRMRTLAALTFSTNIFELFSGGSYENTFAPNIFEHTWFLAIEMQFYLLAPIIVNLVLGSKKKHRDGVKSLGIFMLSASVVSMILMAIYGGIFSETNRAYFAIDTHMFAFCLGGAFAALNYLFPRTPRTHKLIPSIGVALGLAIITIFSFKVSFENSVTFLFALPFTAIVSAIIIACIIKLQRNEYEYRKTPLIIRILDKLGSYSYGVYLFHWPIYILLPHLFDSEMSPAFYATVNIVASLGLTILVSKIFDFAKIFKAIKARKFSSYWLSAAAFIGLMVASSFTLMNAPKTSSITRQLSNMADESASVNYVAAAETAKFVDFDSTFSALQQKIDQRVDEMKGQKRPADSGHGAANANSADVLVLGDSVTLGAKQALESKIKNVYVDAKESRGIETATGLIAGYAATGRLPKVIVISLVTNERTITSRTFDAILSAAGEGHDFILVTGYAGPQQPRDVQNAVIREYAKKHKNVYVADWWNVGHDHWELMYGDHIHLNPEGRNTYANLIANVLQGIPK